MILLNVTLSLFLFCLVGARIIKAENVTVKAGEKAELSCTVDGLPQPKVIWTVALQDSNPKQGSRDNNGQVQAVAPFIKKVYIDNASREHQRKYACLAKNTIIKDGVKTTVIDTATMMLTVQGQLQSTWILNGILLIIVSSTYRLTCGCSCILPSQQYNSNVEKPHGLYNDAWNIVDYYIYIMFMNENCLYYCFYCLVTKYSPFCKTNSCYIYSWLTFVLVMCILS